MAQLSRDIEVLVVDDSAVVRQVMTTVLSQEPGMRVTVAADPLIAMDKMKARSEERRVGKECRL